MAGQSSKPDPRRVPADRTGESADDSILRGGLRGIALVALATVVVAAVAGVLAIVVSLLY
jgi:hypothetical protein